MAQKVITPKMLIQRKQKIEAQSALGKWTALFAGKKPKKK